MKKHKGKTKRWLAGILSAVLVIGSINLVDALEGSNGESALYDAPELTITQGATDYDLMKDITYDNSLYELAVVNDGGFDVNTVGDYEVTYSLTSKDDGTLDPGDSGNGEVKDPDDTKDPTDTEDSKNENGSSESGDASNSDNENKDQNSGDNQGGDNTQTGDNSDNAGSDNGSDSSDSSNAGDSADAGQGDTNSDSSNAGDSADAGQGDTSSDSSNAEDTADAVSGEDAAQSEENTVDTGVLGVSRPRTGVDMNYQSEPVGAEAVDVTKGDDTNTVDTQEKQVITFTRTVHVVAASEDKESVYVAQELVLIQGEEDYDLTDDILYDDEKYTLEVVELGGFDINKIGSYEVTYSLTPVTTEGTQGNGQDDTQENQVITFQRTVTVKEAGEENALYEASDLTVFLGDEDYDLTDGITYDSDLYDLSITDLGGFDIYVPGDYEVSYELTTKQRTGSAMAETGSEGNASEASQDTEVNTTASTQEDAGGSVTASTSGTTVDSVSGGNAGVVVAAFSRTVSVVIPDTSMYGVATYAVQGNYTIELGNPIWTDDSHTKFNYSYATVDTQGDKVSLMTITVSKGTLNDVDIKDARFTDINKKSATWIFATEKTQEEIQEKIRKITFNYVSNMDVNITIDGNASALEFNALGIDESKVKVTQWTNGHFYMYVPYTGTWSQAYNMAKSFMIAGRKGYLATAEEGQDEMDFMLNVQNRSPVWVGASMLKLRSGADINDIDSIVDNSLVYSGSKQDTNARYYMKWNCGPAAGKVITEGTNLLYGNNNTEPNNYSDGPTNHSRKYNINIQPDVQDWEACMMYITETLNAGFNDIWEGNYQTGIVESDKLHVKGIFVEFGGYEEAGKADPGKRDTTKQGVMAPTNVSPREVEATIDGVKYAPIAEALAVAEAGKTVKIVKATVEDCTGQTLKQDVTIEALDGKTYTATADTVLDIAVNGSITVKDGVLELSNQAPVKVYDSKDGNTYAVTGPDSKSTVNVDNQGDHPYIRGENDGTVQIGNVSYTYKNPAGQMAMVYIPQGMKNNDHVTKAEVAADQQVTIEVDKTNSVVLNGGGNAGDNVTVKRRQDDSKVDVKLPSGAQGTIFGYTVGAAPAGGVTVSQSSAENTGYPDRDYIMVAATGNEVVVDGITYKATRSNQKFYLGTFQVNTTFGAHAGVKGTKPADPHYLEEYTITICPDTGYDLDKNTFVATMKENDNDTADAKNLTFTEEADGSIKVTIPQVTGDITIHAEAKKQTSKLTINGLDGRGTVKVRDGQGQEHELRQGNDSVTVNRNEELTLTFIPDDFTDPYYGDLTGEKGSSFSILTGLNDNTPGAAVTDLFTPDVKDSFNWTEKSYQVKYTPDKAENTLEATFTHSSIMHVHVTGGTVEVNTPGVVKNPTDTESFRHVIVPDHTQVEITLKDTTSHNPVYKAAYWKQASTAGGNDTGTEVTSQLNETSTGSKTYTYKTQAVSASHMLNVSFEQGQNVDVTFTGGNASLVQTGTTSWTDQGSHTYRTLVRNGNTLTMKVQVKEGYGLKSITVNGYTINATAALNNPEYNVAYDEATRTYTHTTKPIDQAWNVVMDFEEQYTVTFVDQKDRVLDTIPAVNGTTIPEDKFTEMQAKTDALKEGNEIFLTWVDKADGNTAYNKNTIITKNNLVLKPVYRKNAGNGGHIENGSDGSILAADDFAIHLRDLRNLTVDNVKDEKYANVTAFDKDGAKVTAQVTVDADELAALKTKSAGTYRNALTFTYNKLSVKVTVEISDAEVTITGRTAHTLTFTGKGGVTYQVQKSDENGGSLIGNVKSAATAAGTGKGTADGLDKAAYYLISHKAYGQAVGRTSLVDAQDIAKQFADDGDQTTTNGKTDKNETASNKNVEVTVDDNGNYKVTLKKNIDHTVEIPDTWENVKIDLGGHTITGDKADDNNTAKPGLDFVKDGSINEHPGTKLEIVNGTIKGGDGSAKHPDGAPGIGASGDTADAGLIIGNDANVIGGNGADGTEGKDGGNGGAGIDGNGKITPTVNGTVTGGNGGKGGDSATGTPGNGGNGGNGISAGDKTITIYPGGTVKGGDAGSGGNATGDNTNPGGNGGNGGTGTETTQPGKTDNNGGTTSGGNGGDGGTSNNGNGGNGGDGGSGSTGENNNNGGTSSGGNGGNGGDSNNGTGGNGGNGGSSGETGGNGGNNSGGNGGNGGDSNSGNGGSGGNGGDSNSGTGGNGGNGGDSNNGSGGNGGNGGGSNNGTGGNGGNGGNSNNGNGGNGGNGGDSNSGNNGNGGSSGSNGNRPGGNGGGSNNGNGGNGGNNGGDNSGNNGGDNGGNNGGDNSNNNSGNTGNTPDAGNTAGNDSGNNAHKGNKGNSTGNSNAGQKDPAEDDSLNDAADESSLTGDADGSDADGSDADGIQEEESIHADSDSVENGTDSDSHIPFGECGFHWIPIVWLLVILGYTVVRVKKLRDESEEA